MMGLLLAACSDTRATAADAAGGATGGVADHMPEDLPAGGCRAGSSTGGDCEEGSSSSGSGGDGTAVPECVTSEACDGAGVCVATWEDGVRGAFGCRFACIPTLDEVSWCSDDASCCDPDAVCSPRGYCLVLPDAGSGGSRRFGGNGPRLSDEMPEDLPAGGDPRQAPLSP